MFDSVISQQEFCFKGGGLSLCDGEPFRVESIMPLRPIDRMVVYVVLLLSWFMIQ